MDKKNTNNNDNVDSRFDEDVRRVWEAAKYNGLGGICSGYDDDRHNDNHVGWRNPYKEDLEPGNM